jgi:hypothetical protein
VKGQPTRFIRGHSLQPYVPAVERFWKRVNKNGPIPEHCPELGPCYLWTGRLSVSGGYGAFKAGGKDVPAHRFAWELENGPMPAHLKACHHCDNRPCVRESHIYAGTDKDNSQDMMRRGRWVRVSRAGERNGRAKLTLQKVEAIRGARPKGRAEQMAFARECGVSLGTIRNVLSGRIWP